MIMLPFQLWLEMNRSQSYYYGGEILEPEQRALHAMADALRVGLSPVPVFLVSVLAALAVFPIYINLAPRI